MPRMSINYQLISESRHDEKGYHADYDSLLADAETESEKEYIRKVIQTREKVRKDEGYTYNLIYITKQACGHYELFQHPCSKKHYPLKDVLEYAVQEAHTRSCTGCVCGGLRYKIKKK